MFIICEVNRRFTIEIGPKFPISNATVHNHMEIESDQPLKAGVQHTPYAVKVKLIK